MAKRTFRRWRGVTILAVTTALMLAGALTPVSAQALTLTGYLSVSPHQGTIVSDTLNPATIPSFTTPAACPAGSDSYLLTISGHGLPAGGVIWTAGDAGFSLTGPFTVDAGLSIADATAGNIAPANLMGTYQVVLDCIASSAPGTSLGSFTTTLELDGPANHWVAGTNPVPGGGSTSMDDLQYVQVNVPTGSLIISTPYTPGHPFDLGSLHLTPDGSSFTTTAAFGTLAHPEDGITVVDTRAGNLGWTLSASTTDFEDSSGDVINGENLGFTDLQPVFIADNALQSGIIATDQVAASPPVAPGDPGTLGLKGPPHLLASTDHGIGSVHLIGTMTLNAPTSTLSGSYTATVTFTVV